MNVLRALPPPVTPLGLVQVWTYDPSETVPPLGQESARPVDVRPRQAVAVMRGSTAGSLTAEEATTSAPAARTTAVKDAADLVVEVFKLARARRKADAIDLIYRRVDELLLARDFDRVNWVMGIASNSTLSPTVPLSVFLSLLTITRPWQAALRKDIRNSLLGQVRLRVAGELAGDQARLVLAGLT